ncbi:MAG: ATP-binding domain-containing protein [Actinomycetota bacterium]|nr:ATP-binding domain-containing protein [Actinomycetota bacterium]
MPTNKGTVGVYNLNKAIQKRINNSGAKISGPRFEFRLNDKVIQLKNNYDKDVYNGDIGFIKYIDSKLKEVTIDFEGRNVLYNFYELDELTLSYAISIHKSQGSEFPCIIVPLLTSHYMLLQRNLLYTAITRAQQVAILIGSKKAIGIAINRNIVGERYTGLKEMLA